MLSRSEIERRFAQWWFKHMEASARCRLWKKLAKFMNNSVPVLQGLEIMYARRKDNHGASDPQVIALRSWIDGMNNGKRLAQTLDGWVGPIEHMLIAAGETSGTLESSLISATRVMESRRNIKTAVINGLAYPVVLIIASIIVLYIFGFTVVPGFTNVVPADRFHGMAAVLVALSAFVRSWIVACVGAFAAFLIVFLVSLPRWDGRYRVYLDRYPPYSVYRMIHGSSWLIALSSMLEAGVRLEAALQQLSSMADSWLENRINAALQGMRAGLQLGPSLSRSGYEFPDREIIDDLEVYSGLSGFDEALSILGKEWLTESVTQIEAKMRLIFYITLLIAGSIIGATFGGMISMQMQMNTAIQYKSM